MKNKKIRIGTVFSGIGAPEQAASRVAHKVKNVFACEIDKFARDSYKAIYNIKDKHFHTDVMAVDFTQYRKKIDILVGGSPCQSFSIAGAQRGFDDTRGTLFHEFARAVKEAKPKYFIFENVKGMVSHDNGNTLDIVLRTFGELGYAINLDILNSAEHGIPQNRERFFIVGKRKTKGCVCPKKRAGSLTSDKAYNKMIDLCDEGALNVWNDYRFPEKETLTRTIGDILEDEGYSIVSYFIYPKLIS